MRLRDIYPEQLAQATHDALMGRLWRISMSCGVTDPIVPSMTPSEAWIAVHHLARFAIAGVLPENRAELVEEYLSTVSQYADWLGEDVSVGLSTPRTPLQIIIAGAGARETLAREKPVTTSQLAVLASLSQGRLVQLQQSGDAPRGRKERNRGKGASRARLVPSDDAREWLSGRGVVVNREA